MSWVAKTIAMMSVGLLLFGCSDQEGGETARAEDPASSSAPSPEPPADPSPALGGRLGARHEPPARPMDRLEKPIASRLAAQVAGQGLSLDYLDCPRWDGKAPQRLTCKGYLDGVTADVRVRLTTTTTSVNFDAELQDGVLATANLVRQLKVDGYTRIDCGNHPAYPTVVGSELVCSVREGDEQKYVVAEVLDRSGTVEISDY